MTKPTPNYDPVTEIMQRLPANYLVGHATGGVFSVYEVNVLSDSPLPFRTIATGNSVLEACQRAKEGE